jgi:hypothetical protein
MARKVLVRLVDDLDGLPSEGVATVTFSLDRVTYQIDLNESNASKLRDGLAGFIAAARRTGGRVKRGAASGGRAAANDGPAIREWAREQGHQLAERGRIPSHIVDEYRAATGNGTRAKVADVTEVAPARPARKVAAKTAAASRSAAATTATASTRGSRTRTAGTKAAPAKAAPKTAPKTTAKAAPKSTARTARTTAKAAPKATDKTADRTARKAPAAKAATARTASPKGAAKTSTAKTSTGKTAAAKTAAAKTPRSAVKTPRATASTVAKPAQRTRRAPAGKSS